MADDGFEFRPPTERRDPKRFEPPPWEREAFEAQERNRRVDEVAERPADESPDASGGTAPPAVEAGTRDATAGEDAAGGSGRGPAEAEVLQMLAGLASEEPKPSTAYVPVAVGVGLALLALGGMLLVWAMAALVSSRRTGSMGQVGGAGLGLFGVFFLGMGVWLVYRTLKQRGVL